MAASRALFLPPSPLVVGGEVIYSSTSRRGYNYRTPTRKRRLGLKMCREEQVPQSSQTEQDSLNQWVIDDVLIQEIVQDTMLDSKPLAMVYDSRSDGFNNEEFFSKMIPLDGVPSLVLGITSKGERFGGYTSHGFAARDDYREARTERGLFVFAVRDGEVVVAESTDRVLYDFYDYAIRFGAGLLGIPMNPSKHVMKANVGTSSCKMTDGFSSVFGDSTLATLDRVEVLVAKEYYDACAGSGDGGSQQQGLGGFVRNLFKNTRVN